MKLNGKLVVFTLIIVGVALLIYMSGISSLITFDQIKIKSVELKHMVDEHYARSVAFYIALFTCVAAASIPLVVILALVGGFLFGALLGALYATIGATLGGVLAFVVFRYFLRSFIQEHYAMQFDHFNEKVHVYGYHYILILHYLTIVPLFVINMFAALTPITLGQFVLFTMVGSGPLFLVYSFAGRELATISCVRDIFSFQLFIACALLIVLALIPMLINRHQKS